MNIDVGDDGENDEDDDYDFAYQNNCVKFLQLNKISMAKCNPQALS